MAKIRFLAEIVIIFINVSYINLFSRAVVIGGLSPSNAILGEGGGGGAPLPPPLGNIAHLNYILSTLLMFITIKCKNMHHDDLTTLYTCISKSIQYTITSPCIPHPCPGPHRPSPIYLSLAPPPSRKDATDCDLTPCMSDGSIHAGIVLQTRNAHMYIHSDVIYRALCS